jgi:hypothetical protein
MALQVVHGATLVCSAGSAPCSLIVAPPPVLGEGKPEANNADHIPGTNVPGFSACAILGAPCAPSLPSPWTPASPNVLVRGLPAVRNIDTLKCTVGGIITVAAPGQGTVVVN